MSTTVVLLLVALAGGAAVAILLYLRSRPEPEQQWFYHRCFTCRRRLRYQRQQSGHEGMCPRCRIRFIYPVVPAK